MSTIEERAIFLLNPVLGECVKQRTAAGVAKYGQRLDDNYADERARGVHLVQELLDATQYALWMGQDGVARECANLARGVQTLLRLTAEEIMAGGKQ